MGLFSSEVYSTGEELTRAMGLWDLIPGAILDAKIFEPCGYSLNAIVQVRVGLSVTVRCLCVCMAMLSSGLTKRFLLLRCDWW